MKKKMYIVVVLLLSAICVAGLLYTTVLRKDSASPLVPFFIATSTSQTSSSSLSYLLQNTAASTSLPASQNIPTGVGTPSAGVLASKVVTMAWLFPGKTSCTAQSEYSDGRQIQVLKPQYFTVTSDGSLELLTQTQTGCAGYSPENIASIKAHSTSQFVTVSSGIDGLQGLTSESSKQSTAITQLTNFVVTNNLTGIEIDFEDFGSWSPSTYQAYLGFLQQLGTSLHAQGKQLMVDVPPIGNANEQSYYLLSYKDIASLPIDYIVVMAYDYQFDQGAGSPIAPNAWVVSVIQTAKQSIPLNRLVIGIPSYAYSGTTGSFRITRQNYAQMESVPGFATASRDSSSYERIFQYDGKSYIYVDKTALDAKLLLIESYGIQNVSVWSLGGNQWF